MQNKYLGKTIELAGDALTESQIAETFTKVIGSPVTLAATSRTIDAVHLKKK